jgi:hypothetical protein
MTAASRMSGWERVAPDGVAEDQSVLFTAGRAPEINVDQDLYGWLVGSWALDVIDHGPGGERWVGKGEVHAAWVLEGRAVQDVWIMPPRAERGPGRSSVVNNRYGTTIRAYDPACKAWRITWINPVTGAHNVLVGKRQGDEIVQEGIDDRDGSLMRWRFTEIRPDAFHWIGESSIDDGKTWNLGAEFFAHRTSDMPLR